MPTRAVSMNDDLYVDIHKEMEKKEVSFSQVVVRRLTKLKSIEAEQNVE
jgi:predicted CopG family antitoxin